MKPNQTEHIGMTEESWNEYYRMVLAEHPYLAGMKPIYLAGFVQGVMIALERESNGTDNLPLLCECQAVIAKLKEEC